MQREGMDYLLTVENPHHKLELLEKGSITMNQMCINIETFDWRVR